MDLTQGGNAMVSNTNLQNLDPQLRLFLTDGPRCHWSREEKEDLGRKLDKVQFSADDEIGSVPDFTEGGWSVFVPRRDSSTGSHLDVVIDAQKIMHLLERQGLAPFFAIQPWFIYWTGTRLMAVSKAIPLSNMVAKPTSEFAAHCVNNQSKLVGQTRSLIEQKPKYELNIFQADGLAMLAFEGYVNLAYNRLFFTPERKVAILNPKLFKERPSLLRSFSAMLGTKDFVTESRGITLIANLKLGLSSAQAQEAADNRIRKIDEVRFFKATCVLAGVMWKVVTVLETSPSSTLENAFKIMSIGLSIMLGLFVVVQVAGILSLKHISHHGLAGVNKINSMDLLMGKYRDPSLSRG
jgi:hypothetical protein